MSLPTFPTNRFGPSFTLGPTTPVASTTLEAGRTTPEATPFSSDNPSFPNNILQQSGLTPGQVIGITVGATAGLVSVIIAIVWMWNWRRQRGLAARREQDRSLGGSETEGGLGSDPEKPDGGGANDAMGVAPGSTGETVEMPAPRGLHEMPETVEGPAVELPAPVERSELPG